MLKKNTICRKIWQELLEVFWLMTEQLKAENYVLNFGYAWFLGGRSQFHNPQAISELQKTDIWKEGFVKIINRRRFT